MKIKDKVAKIGLQASFFFIIIQVSLWLYFWKKLPPQVPLFYSRPWGEKQLTSPWLLGLLPAASLGILIANYLLAILIAKNEKLAHQLLIIFSLVFSLLCLITLLKIILLSI